MAPSSTWLFFLFITAWSLPHKHGGEWGYFRDIICVVDFPLVPIVVFPMFAFDDGILGIVNFNSWGVVWVEIFVLGGLLYGMVAGVVGVFGACLKKGMEGVERGKLECA